MRANWWGIATEQVHKLLGRISPSEVISGIPGSPMDHFGVSYSITEEFVAVYRMHPLIPDTYQIRSARTDQALHAYRDDTLARILPSPAKSSASQSVGNLPFGSWSTPHRPTLSTKPRASSSVCTVAV